ncbi:MAG: hypothetical protein IJU53_02120 [Thermoguttaceae bacterium]|nr:hypothetical protein [Thermoguttaceae bacterium]
MVVKFQDFKFTNYDRIGDASAENDSDFLDECFVDTGLLKRLLCNEESRYIILGRTGAGKTALLNIIGKKNEKHFDLDVENLCFANLTSSNICQNLIKLDIDLAPFCKAFWNYIIGGEILRHLVPRGCQNWIYFATNCLTDKKYKQAIDILNSYEANLFTTSLDERVSTITHSIERKIGAQVSGIIGPTGEFIVRDENSKQCKSEIQQIVSTEIAQAQTRVNEIIKGLMETNKYSLYVTIDHLDQLETEKLTGILLRTLVDSVGTFNKIHNLKILIGLRNDLFDYILSDHRNYHIQKEKYESSSIEIKWNKTNLKDLVDTRIQKMLKSHDVIEKVETDEIFTQNINYENKKIKFFDFLIERTWLRPRDVIDFINKTLGEAVGTNKVTQRDVLDAMPKYKKSRIGALIDEWKLLYPDIEILLNFLKTREIRDSIENWNLEVFKNELETLYCNFKSNVDNTELIQFLNNPKENFLFFRKFVIKVLYQVGAIGIKPKESHNFEWFYKDGKEFDDKWIKGDTIIQKHLVFETHE